ncbi:uncharacterized [Tachysurus ichikawai]
MNQFQCTVSSSVSSSSQDKLLNITPCVSSPPNLSSTPILISPNFSTPPAPDQFPSPYRPQSCALTIDPRKRSRLKLKLNVVSTHGAEDQWRNTWT